MAPKVSFVIPAHNEELLIGSTVLACNQAGRAIGGDFEIVVACDGCTDRTDEIATAAGAKVTHTTKRIIAGARNAGAAVATGELLIFVDADTSPPPESVVEAVSAIRAGAVGGGAGVVLDGRVHFAAEVLLAVINRAFRMARLTGGCFLFCTRPAFEAAGGWDETLLVSEEIAMAGALKKIGRFEIVRTPVITSGRKLRTYSAWEFVKIFGIAIVRPNARRDRKHLDLWYGKRREDSFTGDCLPPQSK